MCRYCKEAMMGVDPKIIKALDSHKTEITFLANSLGKKLGEYFADVSIAPEDRVKISPEELVEIEASLAQHSNWCGLIGLVMYHAALSEHSATLAGGIAGASNEGLTLGWHQGGAINFNKTIN